MRLIPNDLNRRVQLALATGETGDWEVIEHLATNDLVTEWTRTDQDGNTKRIPNDGIRACVHEMVEMRPDEPEATVKVQ